MTTEGWHLEICIKPRIFLLTPYFYPRHCQHHSLLSPGSFICHKEERTQIYPDKVNEIQNGDCKLTIKSRHKLGFEDQDIYSPTIDSRPKNREAGPGWTLQDGQPGLGGGLRVIEINNGGGITRLEVSGVLLGTPNQRGILTRVD